MSRNTPLRYYRRLQTRGKPHSTAVPRPRIARRARERLLPLRQAPGKSAGHSSGILRNLERSGLRIGPEMANVPQPRGVPRSGLLGAEIFSEHAVFS